MYRMRVEPEVCRRTNCLLTELKNATVSGLRLAFGPSCVHFDHGRSIASDFVGDFDFSAVRPSK